MAGFLSMFLSLFCKPNVKHNEYMVADTYIALREQALKVTAEQLGIQSTDSRKLLGVLMESGYKEGVITLITMTDGTVSLYFSNGGGIIGVGQHEEPRKVCESFLSFAPDYIKMASLTTDFPLPKKEFTRFYFITSDGIYTIEEKESNLGENKSALSPLFYKAQEVITQARIASEKQGVKQN